MPSGLKRVYGKGDLHFVTFSCFERRPLLYSAEARNLLVHELDMVRRKTNFRLIGYVVMPNHVHLLISEPLTGTVSTVLHKLKLGFSRKIRKEKRCAARANAIAVVPKGNATAGFLAVAILRF